MNEYVPPPPPLWSVPHLKLPFMSVSIVSQLTRFVTLSAVVVAFVAKRFPAVRAVELAYGNCDAAAVEEEKKAPCVDMLVVVAAVPVANVLRNPNG